MSHNIIFIVQKHDTTFSGYCIELYVQRKITLLNLRKCSDLKIRVTSLYPNIAN